MSKFKDGALFALGFTPVAVALTFGIIYLIEDFLWTGEVTLPKNEKNLAIVDTELVVRDERLVVLGKLTNKGEQSWSRITLKANLFGSDSSFLDQCESTQTETLDPSGDFYIKIECSSCSDLGLDDIESFEVKVANAY